MQFSPFHVVGVGTFAYCVKLEAPPHRAPARCDTRERPFLGWHEHAPCRTDSFLRCVASPFPSFVSTLQDSPHNLQQLQGPGREQLKLPLCTVSRNACIIFVHLAKCVRLRMNKHLRTFSFFHCVTSPFHSFVTTSMCGLW